FGVIGIFLKLEHFSLVLLSCGKPTPPMPQFWLVSFAFEVFSAFLFTWNQFGLGCPNIFSDSIISNVLAVLDWCKVLQTLPHRQTHSGSKSFLALTATRLGFPPVSR
ncbi:hypothetical protein XENORESO_000243, partial [Xenotaenia resolanae]